MPDSASQSFRGGAKLIEHAPCNYIGYVPLRRELVEGVSIVLPTGLSEPYPLRCSMGPHLHHVCIARRTAARMQSPMWKAQNSPRQISLEDLG